MKYFLSIAAAILLTIYQIPQIARIIRRRSSNDFSIPAYALVWTGLACYVGATWGTPANIAALVSLGNVSVLVCVIAYFRGYHAKK